ncbi:MAG: hypothetical protein SXA11_23385, partial [Cyanobacteriota bacterium]|nr:hypothetical protein [Cyanobacteriota bacterium]
IVRVASMNSSGVLYVMVFSSFLLPFYYISSLVVIALAIDMDESLKRLLRTDRYLLNVVSFI